MSRASCSSSYFKASNTWYVFRCTLTKTMFADDFNKHERNIVHRDIKPENILVVDKNLHGKLADYRLAKIMGDESVATPLCGAARYAAAETLADSKQRR